MKLTHEDFGVDWSRYEHKWFSARLAWTSQPSSCKPVYTNRSKKTDELKGRRTTSPSARLEEMNCDQILNNAHRAMGAIKAMAHTDRLSALLLIAEKPRKVGELTEILGARQPVVSQLLAKLRDGNLVKATRIGKQIEYSIIDDKIGLFIEHFSKILSTLPATKHGKEIKKEELRI